MENLLNFFSSKSGIAFLTLSILIIIGTFSVLREKIRNTLEIRDIEDYIKHLNAFFEKIKSQQYYLDEVESLIEQEQKIGNLIHGYISYPVGSLVNNIVNECYNELNNDAKEINILSIKKIKSIKDANKELNWDFVNPFTLFYKGIGLTLIYLFGYQIKLFCRDFDFEEKPWKIFVGIISFISMLMTIACFFGLDFNSIMSKLNL